jgi:AraC family transcriptional regulator
MPISDLPRFENLSEKKMAGFRIRMSFAGNTTFLLWQKFMSRRREITNAAGPDLFSIEVYNAAFFDKFDAKREFEKWAAMEVTGFENLPDQMEALVIPAGLYAVFVHRGPASGGAASYEYIFRTWMPSSDFLTDDRPHFAVMGAKYRHEQQDSEEEIWIPIRPKNN